MSVGSHHSRVAEAPPIPYRFFASPDPIQLTIESGPTHDRIPPNHRTFSTLSFSPIIFSATSAPPAPEKHHHHVSMECNKEEAVRALELAEAKLQRRDVDGARRLAQKAQRLFPSLPDIPKTCALIDVLNAAPPGAGEPDWYAVLGIREPTTPTPLIRKQYRALALLLHPDKNASVYACEGFKLVGQAWTVLSNVSTRAAYDARRPAPSCCRKSGKDSSAAPTSGCDCGSSVAIVKTLCVVCKEEYEVGRELLGCSVSCKHCGAISIVSEAKADGPPPVNEDPGKQMEKEKRVFSSSAAKVDENATKERHNADVKSEGAEKNNVNGNGTRSNSCTGGRKKATVAMPTSIDSPNKMACDNRGRNATAASFDSQAKMECVNPGRSAMPSSFDSQSKMECDNRGRSAFPAECMHGDGDMQTQKPMSGKKKKNDYQHLTSAENEVHAVPVSEKKSKSDNHHTDPRQNDVGAVHVSEKKENDSMKSPRSEVNAVSGSEKKRESDNQNINSTRNEVHAVPLSEEKSGNHHTNIRNEAPRMPPNVEVVDLDVECKKTVGSEVPSMPMKVENDDASCSRQNAPVRKRTRVKERVNYSETRLTKNHAKVTIPDADFYSFCEQVSAELQVGQVWALYGDTDKMPRFYAYIEYVLSKDPFSVRIQWLEAKTEHSQVVADWVDAGLYLGCGEFQSGETQDVHSLDWFSHQILYWENTPDGDFRIMPGRGEIWALYKNWSAVWSSSKPASKVIYCYEIVEIATDFDPDKGFRVIPLMKLENYVSVFKRGKRKKIVSIDEMLRFSHTVPFKELAGDEDPGLPRNCVQYADLVQRLKACQLRAMGSCCLRSSILWGNFADWALL